MTELAVKNLILEKATEITEKAKESLGGLKTVAIGEAWKILQLATAGVVQIIESVASDLEGKQKKEIALEYLSLLYDKVFLVIDIPVVPNLIEPLIHKYVKAILMILVASSIDATVAIFRQTGIFLRKELA